MILSFTESHWLTAVKYVGSFCKEHDNIKTMLKKGNCSDNLARETLDINEERFNRAVEREAPAYKQSKAQTHIGICHSCLVTVQAGGIVTPIMIMTDTLILIVTMTMILPASLIHGILTGTATFPGIPATIGISAGLTGTATGDDAGNFLLMPAADKKYPQIEQPANNGQFEREIT